MKLRINTTTAISATRRRRSQDKREDTAYTGAGSGARTSTTANAKDLGGANSVHSANGVG